MVEGEEVEGPAECPEVAVASGAEAQEVDALVAEAAGANHHLVLPVRS